MNYSHGKTGTKIYYTYNNMINRCYRETTPNYYNYGGRGITVCEEWKNDFEVFYEWAINNGYSEKLTLDRIDVNGNYEPSNCRWVTMECQENNRSNNHLITYNGETKTIAEWSKERNIKYATLERRINAYKWDIQRALEI